MLILKLLFTDEAMVLGELVSVGMTIGICWYVFFGKNIAARVFGAIYITCGLVLMTAGFLFTVWTTNNLKPPVIESYSHTTSQSQMWKTSQVQD